MTRTEYTWKVITMLNHAANIAAGVTPDDLHSGLSTEQAEKLEDELRAGYSVNLAAPDSVSDAAYNRAREIKQQYFSTVKI